MPDRLKLTTRGRYAIMAMVELGRNGEGRPVPLSDIATQGKISLSYLEQLIAGLRKHELVKSYRGPGGGYCLARHTSEITVSDILQAAEDSTPAKRNANNEEIKTENCAHTIELWGFIGEVLHANLCLISLDDVLKSRLKDKSASSKLFEIFG